MADEEVDIKDVVKQLREAYLHCRDYGHDWRPFQVHEMGKVLERVLRCSRCLTECWQQVARKGGRLVGGRRYFYPDDYLIKGLGFFSADDRGIVRLASIAADRKELG